MTLDSIDKDILRRCLDGQPRAWEDFVDRFICMVFHVVENSAKNQGIPLTPKEHENLVETIFEHFYVNHFDLLRQLNHKNHLSTYLTIVTRRLAVRHLITLGLSPVNNIAT